MSAKCQQCLHNFSGSQYWATSFIWWILPSSPQVCEHSDQADHSDSWQLTGHSTTQEMFICHFFSKFSCSIFRKWKAGNSWHIVTTQTNRHGNTQSVTARQQLDLSAIQLPEAFALAGERLCWAASGQQSWNIEAALKAILTQCVFVNEPDDEVGQGLNSCGGSSATARRLQLQGAETHYEWIKHSAWSDDNNLCMGILLNI